MKTIENVTIYKCDFCKKELKRKHAMQNHEIKCMGNPKNQRPCLNGCKHLTRKEIEYDTGIINYDGGDSVFRTRETFYCELKNQFMLHPKLEHRDGGEYLKNVYHQNEEVEQDWMPINCDSFQEQTYF